MLAAAEQAHPHAKRWHLVGVLPVAAAHTHAAMLQAETSDGRKEKEDLLRQAGEVNDTVISDGEELATQKPEALAPISVAFLTETLLPAARILGNGILIEGFGTVDATERQRAHALAVETARHSTSRPGLSYRVRYNMACFWSTWLEHRKTPDVTFDGRTPDAWGLHELELALSGATRARQAKRLATWARRDPSLAPLKATRRDAFTNTLDRY